MRVLLVAEGEHELSGALCNLIKRLFGQPLEITTSKVSDRRARVTHGKGPGYKKKALAWLRVAKKEGYDALVLLIDQDDDTTRRDQFDQAQAMGDESYIERRALGVAIRSFDAWMLSDEGALSQVLESNVHKQNAPETLADPKKICMDLRDNSTLTISLRDMYTQVAQQVNLDTLNNCCPRGFAQFAGRVRQL